MRDRPPATTGVVVAVLVAVVAGVPAAWTAVRGVGSLSWVAGSGTATLVNAGVWVIGATVGTVVVAALLTWLLAPLDRRRWLTALLLVPAASTAAVVAVAWRALFAFRPSGRSQTGLVNEVATTVGLSPVAWLTQEPLVNTVVLAAALVWVAAGPATAVLLAGWDRLHPLPGASSASLRDLLAALRRPLATVALVTAVVALCTHDLVRVATGGSFGTDVPATRAVDLALAAGQPSRGSAFALVLLVAAVALGLVGWALLLRRGPHASPFAPEAIRRGRHRRRADRATGAAGPVRAVLAWIVVVLALVPVVGLVVDALRPAGDVAERGWWTWITSPSASLEPLRTALRGDDGGMWSALLDSLLVAVPATLLAVLAGVALARLVRLATPARRGLLRLALVALVVVPVAAVVLPVAEVVDTAGLGSASVVVVWLIHAAAGAPLVALLLSWSESADGVRGGPAIVGAAALQFVLVWSDLLVSATVLGAAGSGLRPVPVQLATLVAAHGEEASTVVAAAVVAAAVPVVTVLSTWRSIVAAVLGASADGPAVAQETVSE